MTCALEEWSAESVVSETSTEFGSQFSAGLAEQHLQLQTLRGQSCPAEEGKKTSSAFTWNQADNRQQTRCHFNCLPSQFTNKYDKTPPMLHTIAEPTQGFSEPSECIGPHDRQQPPRSVWFLLVFLFWWYSNFIIPNNEQWKSTPDHSCNQICYYFILKIIER